MQGSTAQFFSNKIKASELSNWNGKNRQECKNHVFNFPKNSMRDPKVTMKTLLEIELFSSLQVLNRNNKKKNVCEQWERIQSERI